MLDEVSISIIQNVINTQKDLVIIFHDSEVVMVNKSFKKFFAVSTLEQYKRDFEAFENNFVPHPSYFNKDNILPNSTWFESILKLPELDRIVSMMTPSFEPYAFSVSIDTIAQGYRVVTFNDITQSLIKRIMIENSANIDIESGAYSKEYFLQIAKSYEDAAVFNEKILASIIIHAEKKDGSKLANDSSALSTLVSHFKSSIRQDDMLIRWYDTKFILVFIVDTQDNAKRMLKKLQSIVKHEDIEDFECKLSLHIQEENENMSSLIERISI
jgi:hypothetical protein